MKLSLFAIVLPGVAFAARPVSFNVATSGANCGKGTTISCADAGCKGNFSPAQHSIIVTQASGNCHISLYPQANQQGGVAQRINTDTTGTCVTAGPWLSYGYYCS